MSETDKAELWAVVASENPSDAPQQASAADERLFHLFIDNASDVISVFDRELRFRYANHRLERAAGRTRAEILGKTNEELGLPADVEARRQWQRTLREVFETGQEILRELIVRRPTGRVCHQTRFMPEFAADGTVESVFTISRDVTALLEAKEDAAESGRLLATTLRSIGDAVIATDEDGRITFLNPVAERLTGWSEPEAIGKDCREVFCIVNEETHQEVESPVAHVLREGMVVGLANHTVLIAKDGTERPIDDSGAPIRDQEGSLLGVVLVFRDITEQKRHANTQQFLAEAGALLASSLDYETTLRNVANLAVPRLADWCSVHVVEEDNAVRQLVVAHKDPAKREWAEAMRVKFPYDPDAPRGVPNVLRTGRSEFYSSLPEEILVNLDEERLRLVQELGLTSLIIAPMTARGRTLGAITFVAAESGRIFTEADLTVAEDLAHRAAMAIDNARLYRAAQQEIEARKQREADIDALNVRLKRAMAETHHRVKNNLQVVSALVEVQAREGEEMVPVSALKRIGNHVRGLAGIHDLLTQEAKTTGDAQHLSAQAALEKLLTMLQGTLGERPLRHTVQDVRLSVQKGAALTLIVNELVSNAVKYGRGEIDLSLTISGDTARLEVCDDGPGFPAEFDPKTAAHTGLEIVESVGRWDLGGEIRYRNRPQGGGCVVLMFPIRP